MQRESLPMASLHEVQSEAVAVPATSVPSLLTALVNANAVAAPEASRRDHPAVQAWLQASENGSAAEQICVWMQLRPGDTVRLDRIRRSLSRDIARIDQLLSRQVNQILHAPEFQALESSWRGLHYLWTTRRDLLSGQGLESEKVEVQIRVLNVSKRELKRNFDAAGEFDQNELFRKVYEEEFGTPGGTPYGVLLANYEFTNHPDDIDLLTLLSEVGAAAFAPVITAASPSLLGMDEFSVLEQSPDLTAIFKQARLLKWRSLRERVDTQFLGLTLPRILMRRPYGDSDAESHSFRFIEDVGDGTRKQFLWGNSAWALGAVLLRAFVTTGWFADIRGVEQGVEGGGLVTNLPAYEFQTDSPGAATRSSVEVAISETLDVDLCSLGFIPLSHCKDTEFSVFYSNQSVHQPVKYTDPESTANARISAMLQYVLCCSRIAHYVKVHVREKIGSIVPAEKIQSDIKAWLVDYIVANERARPEIKARYPLREADVTVDEVPGKPGEYSMTLRLLPHYQLDQLTSSMTLLARRVEFKQ